MKLSNRGNHTSRAAWVKVADEDLTDSWKILIGIKTILKMMNKADTIAPLLIGIWHIDVTRASGGKEGCWTGISGDRSIDFFSRLKSFFSEN